jgi:hypothetical protein
MTLNPHTNSARSNGAAPSPSPESPQVRLTMRRLAEVLRAERREAQAARPGAILRIVIWALCLGSTLAVWIFVMALAIFGANNAIQETSAWAMGCFQAITAYIVARGLDSLLC